MQYLIGIDFSIAKPAACIYYNEKCVFYSWIKEISNKNIDLFINAGVKIKRRKNIENKDIVRYDLINSNILSDMIIEDLSQYINKNTLFIFEGTSFASKGNVLISLSVWRYILMNKLLKFIPIEHIITYSPITIKKTAGCSEKGKTKKDMIDAFIHTSSCNLAQTIFSNPSLFQKKTGTWIEHLDDLVDSYFAVQTYLEKN